MTYKFLNTIIDDLVCGARLGMGVSALEKGAWIGSLQLCVVESVLPGLRQRGACGGADRKLAAVCQRGLPA